MKEDSIGVSIQAAVVTDRGLSEKRPLNEDSFLSDTERRIFAVADGVGGAHAGEVASQTAIEVLDEAFRHQEAGSDTEDLMEIAIQRANSSIHRMSREHPKLSMMATTLVALHLDGRIATIGHVGDSRLYRLAPDGHLHRETRDHSVVEEEVRAGRMTPSQAANHPSRNVISRALGAEDGVEVDMKTMEIEDGTAFLLCSDGITRHIPDEEIRDLLTNGDDPEAVCAEMKRRCYERGAEDNLTAVIVRVGERPQQSPVGASPDDEPTLATPRAALPERPPARADDAVAAPSQTSPAGLTTRSRFEVPTPPANDTNGGPDVGGKQPSERYPVAATSQPARGSKTGNSLALASLLVLLFAAVAAAAFYGGQYYQQHKEGAAALANANVSAPAASAPVIESPESIFEKNRREVDLYPAAMASKMASDSNGKPLETTDPEFLYLYGRALLLSGKHMEAGEAFTKSLEMIEERPARDPLKVEAKMAAAVAALRSGNWGAAQTASKNLDEVLELETNAGQAP